MAVSLGQARSAKNRALEVFLAYGPLASIGITKSGGGCALTVSFEAAPSAMSELPADIDGFPVKVDVIGSVREQG
jgi:hypothetical protein